MFQFSFFFTHGFIIKSLCGGRAFLPPGYNRVKFKKLSADRFMLLIVDIGECFCGPRCAAGLEI